MPTTTATSPAIACSLMGNRYAERLAWISALNERGLTASRRDGRSLILTYRQDAAADVERLVRQEKECCAFLAFDLAERGDQIVLSVTASPDAESVLDDVFAPFEKGTACGCAPSDGAACASASANGASKRLAFAAAGLSTRCPAVCAASSRSWSQRSPPESWEPYSPSPPVFTA